MKIFNSICAYIIFDLKNEYRKEGNDWGINIYKWPKIRFVLMVFFVIFLLSSSILLSNLYFHYSEQKTLLLNLITIFIVATFLLDTLFYFTKNKTVFLEDGLKILNSQSEFRFVRVISNFTLSIAKKILFYILCIYIPVYLCTYTLSISNLIISLKIVLFFTFSLFFFTSILSLVQFNIHKIHFNKKSLKIFDLVRYIIIFIMSFIIPFILISTYTNKDFLLELFKRMSSININTYSKIILNFFESGQLFYLLLTILFISSILTIYVWKKILFKKSLIIYNEINKNDKDLSPFIMRNQKVFFSKDCIHILRLDGWVLQYMIRGIIFILISSGIIIPIITKFLGSNYSTNLGISIVLALSIYQIIGDSLKILFSVDGEKNQFYIMKIREMNLWNITKEKFLLYAFIILFISILVSLLSVSYSGKLIFSLVTFNTILTYGLSYGIIQIASTALYPKLNWEHYYEIGQSKKGEKLSNIAYYGLSVYYFNTLGILLIPQKLGLQINTNLLIICINLSYIFLCIIVIVSIKLFLSKKIIEEVLR